MLAATKVFEFGAVLSLPQLAATKTIAAAPITPAAIPTVLRMLTSGKAHRSN
jgi:hypothetical protein